MESARDGGEDICRRHLSGRNVIKNFMNRNGTVDFALRRDRHSLGPRVHQAVRSSIFGSIFLENALKQNFMNRNGPANFDLRRDRRISAARIFGSVRILFFSSFV